MAEEARSKDLSVAAAANRIAELPTWPEVLAFIGDDNRKGVVSAAGLRAADLVGLAPDPGPVAETSERHHPYQGFDVECRRDPATGGEYFPALGQESAEDVLILVGWNGEPGKAVPIKEWRSWAKL